MNRSLEKFKKNFNEHLKSVAILGSNNIKNELLKRGQEATVSYEVKKNKVVFVVEPKTTKIETDKLPVKEVSKLKNVLGAVPIEMFNQEVSQQSFSTAAVEKAMEQTQEAFKKKVYSALSKHKITS
jgi:hypothetical protein